MCLFVSRGIPRTNPNKLLPLDHRRTRPCFLAGAGAQTCLDLPLPGRLTNKHTTGPYRGQGEGSGLLAHTINPSVRFAPDPEALSDRGVWHGERPRCPPSFADPSDEARTDERTVPTEFHFSRWEKWDVPGRTMPRQPAPRQRLSYLLRVTPIFGQRVWSLQRLQWGETGWQRFWPKQTRSSLISIQ